MMENSGCHSELNFPSNRAEKRAGCEATLVPEEVVNLVIGVFLRHFCIFSRNDSFQLCKAMP